MGVPLYTGLYGWMSLGEPREWGANEGAPLGYPMGWGASACWGPRQGVTLWVGVPRVVEVPPWDVPMGQSAPSTHLLQRGVLDSVGIVVVVDDLEVGDRWAGPRPHEPDVQGGLPCPPRLHTEMGGGPHLHPCNTSSSHCRAHSIQKWVGVPTSTPAPQCQSLQHPQHPQYLPHSTHHPHPMPPTPTPPAPHPSG